MKKKIYRSMCLMALLAILLSAFMTTVVYYNNLKDQMHREVATEAHYLAAGLNQVGMEYLDSLPGNVRGASKSRITVVSQDGTVLYDNFADSASLENHKNRPEIQSAFKTGSGSGTRTSSTLSETTFYYALRLADGTVVRVANTTKSVLAGILEMIPLLCAAAAAVLVLSMLLAERQTWGIVRPINDINLDHPSETKIYDELAPLIGKVERQQETIRRQMDTLKAKQREFSAITENMSEGFLVIGKRGEVVSYNSSALRILGVETFIGERKAGDIEEERTAEGIAAAPETGRRMNILSFNRSPIFRTSVDCALEGNHSEQNMELSGRVYQIIANPVMEGNEVSGAIMVILDVTEKAEREDLRREFSANVSHELKTPLTSISGYAEIMKNGLVRAEDMRRFSENIYQEAQRMITLVGDIIKLSQLDESQVELEKTDVDLYDIARAVTDRLKGQARVHKVELKLEGSSRKVLGTAQILDEMIYNLCDNGIKYNKPGGHVTVSVGEDHGHPVVSVEDDGIGIPETDQERVFERFYRVDKSHSRQIGGTGLGLSIVKHGAIYHGARVEMESRMGAGTKVRIVFS